MSQTINTIKIKSKPLPLEPIKPPTGLIVCGVDEVGRGPLAGPVVAAAVILPEAHGIQGLADSKKLTEAKRETLYDQILEASTAVGIGFASEQKIDEINILNASLLAMERAVSELAVTPEAAWVDGNKLPNLKIPGRAIVKGDARVECISAASIIAKVTRDRLMVEFDSKYPGYGFAQHKGYPTVAHRAAIAELGPCEIHRLTFRLTVSGRKSAGF